MKKNKYNIVVLADLKKSVNTTLKSAVSLAKMIDGEVSFFYVKNAAKVVDRDNQLSAIRSINHDYTATDKKIKKIVESVSSEFQVPINYSFSFGNVKHEIDDYIKENKPDIIVLGKKTSNSLNLIGDNITKFVLKQYHGTIFIADTNNILDPNNKISLGVLNNTETLLNTSIAEDLLVYAQKPIKSFKIVDKSDTLDEVNSASEINTIDYVFEQNDNSIDNLSNYITKNNINLLCFDRMEEKSNAAKKNIRAIINKVNVSLLLPGNQNHSLQQ
ncbi:universal stress protein [Mariniflexile gromovii]|uniref:Universal stress protein n=1 Tax=Mariniflexile gromovii TaxID=362523 RepID=A0ABS4BWJ2_9FLAO|nr:universal stress protein [Mariniflexile gromovii]MBP0904738.1 universal stress protein [Mariniflexile gromovii]